MSVSTYSLITVSCDGSGSNGCPFDAETSFPGPQPVALQIAVRRGWTITDSISCPECDSQSATQETGGAHLPATAPPVLRLAS